jgi:diaminohydroxyphosphoribosylaminopyrimidine deaminase/5-amino-6-(5-phosphoribosylamino)uracil reductase
MQRALALAARGIGRAAPNPMVGAVVVLGGRIVGEGYHVYSDGSHAEVVALEDAGTQARGAELYVNLEPCCHAGRTPPCVDAIQESGIKKVYVATLDPNPLVAGKGVSQLRRVGIEVSEGLCAEQALHINSAFFHLMQQRKPLVTLKLGLSLDGRIATQEGESRWVTGEKARKAVHRLRFESDAILTGISTVLSDNPSLDVRWYRRNSLVKVILDSDLRLPLQAKLFESDDRVIVFCSHRAARIRANAFAKKAQIIRVKRERTGLLWAEILEKLGEEGIASLLIEGGGHVAASALRAGVVKNFKLFYGAKFIGGEGVPAIASLDLLRLADAPRLQVQRVRRLGDDIVVEGQLI